MVRVFLLCCFIVPFSSVHGARLVIIIEAVHGGKDAGTSRAGFKEKHLTLKLARALRRACRKSMPGARILMTRKRDRFVSLERRVKLANNALRSNDDLGIFLSLHANASLARRYHGFEIYTLENRSAVKSAKVAALVEHPITQGSRNWQRMQSYLLASRIGRETRLLAQKVNQHLATRLNRLVSSRGVKTGNFHVLRETLMPAILIEVGYFSNKNELHVLHGRKFRRLFIAGVTRAVRNFAKSRIEASF